MPGITLYITSEAPAEEALDRRYFISGTASDVKGYFSLEAEVGNYLVASGIGYSTQSKQITAGQREYNFTLTEELSYLSEVLVVGYGTTEKKDLTGSVGLVKSKELEQIKTQTIDQALVGKVTGVYVAGGGGAPGTGAIVNIRGLAAIQGDNQPLYVVDGVPVIQNPLFLGDGLGRSGNRENPLLSINPADVERIDILKDASSAAIYGSRAANGVILITTKRGKRNQKPRFTFSYDATIQNPTDRLDLLNAAEFRALLEQQEIDVSDFGTADTDWQDLLTNANALWNQYRFNVSGGSEKTSYYFSGTLSDQEGVMPGNNFTRYTLTANLDSEIAKKLTIGNSFQYNHSTNELSGVTSFENASDRPDQAVFNEDGTFTTTDSFFGPVRNALGDAAKVEQEATGQNVVASLYGQYEIIDGLKLKSQLSLNYNTDRGTRFIPSFSSLVFFGTQGFQGASRTNNASENLATEFINTINYRTTIADHHTIDFLAGVSWNKTRLALDQQVYVGFPDDEILTDPGSASNFVSGDSDATEIGLNSFFGRLNYNYKDRYLLTFTARRDGSTKFGPNNRFGYFPSGALAWNVHNEDFLSNNSVISQLKLRGSLGRTGSDNLPSFSFITTYGTLPRGNSIYDGLNGIVSDDIPNSDIRWETTDQLDLGLELGLFNNRLNAEIVYFDNRTSGLILLTPIPIETGASRINTNIADVSNKGWEVLVGGDIFRSGDFSWNSSFNISFIKNRVDALNGGSVLADGRSIGIEEGQPIGVIFGYEVASIAQTQEEIDALNAASPNGEYDRFLRDPGDYIFRDLNGDGEITPEDDRTTLGDITPDYFGGWNNSVSYRNFDLSFNLQFVEGVEREWTRPSSLFRIDGTTNVTRVALDTWTPENPNANFARIGSFGHVIEVNSRNVADASYIRLRSASIGYNIPRQILEKVGIENAKVALSGNNLFTIHDFPDQDPENIQPGSGSSTTGTIRDTGVSYPQTRTFTLSLSIGL